MPSAVSTFTLDVFDMDDPYATIEGQSYQRASIEKSFRGDLEGTSTVVMLSVRGNGGAGYVALETFHATLEGRSGTFALLHEATMLGDGEDAWAKWLISPNSGTGALKGIRGEAKIDIAPDGTHTLTLDYELAEADPAD
jgi:hypothetical protein